MKLNTYLSYTIDEHPNKEKCFDHIRDNWHDLGEHVIQDTIESLKGFSDHYNLDLHYSISIFPDRGEYIKAKINDEDIASLTGPRLFKYLINNHSTIGNPFNFNKPHAVLAGNCPFTGVCYDETLLDNIRAFMKKPDSRTFQELINDCTDQLLTEIHNEGDYIYSDIGLLETCQANEYQFTENGQIV